VAIGLTLAVLVAAKIWARAGPAGSRWAAGPTAAGGLLLIGWAAGLSRTEMGFGNFRAGVWLAAGAVVALACAYAIGLLIPYFRPAFLDPVHRVPLRRAVFLALVAVPVATVLVEEVAFRGVLFGLIGDDLDATVATAVLFGLWHADQRHGLARLGVVVFTGLAGALFAVLRLAGGNLAAPFLLHWAANGLGIVASAWAWRQQRSSR